MSSAEERLVFTDIESGGLELDRPIMQIAAIAVDSDLNELESFEIKIRFDESEANPDSLRKNSYCPKLWARIAVPEDVAARQFAAFLRRHATVDLFSANRRVFQVARLVAHNASFDGPFLHAWFQHQHVFLPAAYRVLCTLQRIVWLFHEDQSLTPPADYRLETLCQYFGVPLCPHEAHDALVDTRATLELYRAVVRHSRRHQFAPDTKRRAA